MLLGRICISMVFVTSAVSKIFSWDESVRFMTTALTKMIAGTPMPDFMHGLITFVSANAVFFLILATICEGVGGLLVLLGVKVQFGAILIILFIVPVTLIMHPFWLEVGPERITQLAHFMTNLAILGGLFILAAKGGEPTA